MSEQLERPLTTAEKIALAAHRFLCGHCERFGRQIGALHAIAPHLNETFSENGRPAPCLSPAARSRIQELLSRTADR